MQTAEAINYYDTFECKEQIKQLTDEIIGCNSRINGFIMEHKISGHDNTLSQLKIFKDTVSSNYQKLKSKELVFGTEQSSIDYIDNLSNTWHLFHNFEKSVKEKQTLKL